MAGTDSTEHALDLDFLRVQTFGDRALERELLELFEQQCRRLLPAVAGRSSTLTRGDAAHTLKGAARAVGAGRVAALADAFEDAVEHGRHEGRLMRLAGELDRAVEEVVAAIALRQQAPG